MNVSLVMFKADGTRRDFPIGKSRVVLGRTNHCDLRIPLSSVSRQHCELRVTDTGVRLRDLGSSNGTYHNNNRVKEAMLAPGDEIGIGKVVFTVVIDGKPARIEPVRTPLDRTSVNQTIDMGQTIEAMPILDDDDLPTGNGAGGSLVAMPIEDDDSPTAPVLLDDSDDELSVLDIDDLLLDDDDDDDK